MIEKPGELEPAGSRSPRESSIGDVTMKLPPEGARWLISLRWFACGMTLFTIWFCSSVLDVVAQPLPLYLLVVITLSYNVVFLLNQKDWAAAGQKKVERNIMIQVLCDLVMLTLLLYFADLSRNPFLFFFVFHMIIAGMYLRGWVPFVFAGLATVLVGTIMLLEYLEYLPSFRLRLASDPAGIAGMDGLYLLGVFVAFASTEWIAVYFTTSIRGYVDRAHAEIRQKEKLLGIGHLVAGIAHQIANPLDGLENGLQRIGERVKNDPRATEYVKMMFEALKRIEHTAKRVQAFARPHGITLTNTDLNAVVEATLPLLGITDSGRIQLKTDLGHVPFVSGDPYTLQEVLFNLCTNALAAMPRGGALTLRTLALGRRDDDQMGSVALEVSDTGVGIARANLDKIFEPFFTTRGESGGTGLGLGLCRMLISEMGGRIEVRSILGEGTTFTVVLNRAA